MMPHINAHGSRAWRFLVFEISKFVERYFRAFFGFAIYSEHNTQPQDLLLPGDTMSVRDPLIEGDGEFHSYVEDTEIETGYSVAHLDLFLSRVSIYADCFQGFILTNQQVYNYYVGKGFLCILLTNGLNLVYVQPCTPSNSC